MVKTVVLLSALALTEALDRSACAGTEDPTAGEYQGTVGIPGLANEDVTIIVKSFADGSGVVDFTGAGMEAFTCSGKHISKIGSDVDLEDSSDCLPDGIALQNLQYCSADDTIHLKIKDSGDHIPLPIPMTLKRVSAAESTACKGTDDPMPGDYKGTVGIPGLANEDVSITIKSFSDGAGLVDFTGAGMEAFTCSGKQITKTGSDVDLEDSSECLPDGIALQNLQYCSGDDTIHLKIKDSGDHIPLPIPMTLKRVSAAESTACKGTDDPMPGDYKGTVGIPGLANEDVSITIKSFSDGAGLVDFTGAGMEAFTCSGKQITKTGNDVDLEDSSDCLPDGIALQNLQYCSADDTIHLKIKDSGDHIPLPIPMALKRVSAVMV